MIELDFEKYIEDGKDLEIFATSYFQSLDYYVENNLKWIEDNESGSGNIDILEIDVLAKKISADFIHTTLVECKRGCTFNDLFKFSGIAKLVNVETNILLCQSKLENELKSVGRSIGIDVITPEDLIVNLTDDSIEEKFDFFFNSNNIVNKLFDKDSIKSKISSDAIFSDPQKLAYNEIRKCLAILIGKLWREPDLCAQSLQLKELMASYSDFVRKTARILDLKPGNKPAEYYMRINSLCQAAGYLVLKIRVSYIICAIQSAQFLSVGGTLNLAHLDSIFCEVIDLFRKDINLATKIPIFLQSYIYIFGGFYSSTNQSDFIDIAKYLKIEYEEACFIIKLLEKFFSLPNLNIQWGFVEDMGVISLKYIPYPLKGLGILNREKLGLNTENFVFRKEWVSSLK